MDAGDERWATGGELDLLTHPNSPLSIMRLSLLKQCLPKLPRLALNLQSSRLSFKSSCADWPAHQTLALLCLHSFNDSLLKLHILASKLRLPGNTVTVYLNLKPGAAVSKPQNLVARHLHHPSKGGRSYRQPISQLKKLRLGEGM